MLHDWGARSRVSRQRPDVAVAAFIQDPIGHRELMVAALFGSCCGSACEPAAPEAGDNPAVVPAPAPLQGTRRCAQLEPLPGLACSSTNNPQEFALNRMLLSLGTATLMALSIA